jgi:hypothetical protein
MRKIKDVLRLKFEAKLSHERIAAATGISKARRAGARANIEIIIVDSPATRVSVCGELHGFGLPTSRLLEHAQFDAAPVPTLVGADRGSGRAR